VRRRTRQHRRNRLIRRAVLATALILGGLTGAAFLPVDFGSFLAASFSSRPPAEWNNNTDVRRDLAFSATPGADDDRPSRETRPVYPYSIVPGGVHDPKELERVFEHDPVVASHYRDFDFRRARVVQLTQDKTVYVSYRIGAHVYWTTKRVLLRRGEKVITDGKTTLRTRCGNEVSETARKDVSPKEPAMARLETPIQLDPGTAAVIPYPTNFESSLRRSNLPVIAMAPPGYSLILGSGGTFTLYPPPLPSCTPGKKKKGEPSTGASTGGKKGSNAGCGNPPGQVPEPGTFILVSTGLVGGVVRYRQKRT
jgi:hypothetical protein